MKKIVSRIMVLSFLLLVLAFPIFSNTYAASKDEHPLGNYKINEINVVMDDNYPPFVFRDSEGILQGILIDEWTLFEKKTGVKVNLEAKNWNAAQQEMLNGKFDVIDTIFNTQERRQQYDFSSPYADINVPIFFSNAISGITDARSLLGFIVAVKSGDAAIEYLKSQRVTTFEEYDSYEQLVIAAKEGKVVVFVADEPAILYLLHKYDINNEFNYTQSLYTGQFCRAVLKGNIAMLNLVENGFAQISEKEHKEIEQRWYGKSSVNVAQISRIILLSSGIIIIALAILFVWNRTLSHTIKRKTSEIMAAIGETEQSNKKLNGIIVAIPDLVFLLNSKGVILDYLSESTFLQVDQPKEQIVGKTLSAVMPLDIAEDGMKKIRLLLVENQTQEHNYSLEIQGEKNFYEARYVLIDADMILCIIRDITKERKYQEKLYNMSVHDSVTGLYNRTFFEKEVNRIASGNYLNIGIIMSDIDGLKLVNDTMGHKTGDQYLNAVGGILSKCLGKRGIISRIGGDEFAIIIIDTSMEEINGYGEKIETEVKELNPGYYSIPISISIGYSIAKHGRRDISNAIIEADDNMYRHKLHHRQSVRSYSIDVLSKMLAERDFITEGHAERMRVNINKMALEMGLNPEAIDDIVLFAQFHDIGKIGVSDAILFKSEPLNGLEWSEMRRHCEIGFRVAESSPDLRHIADWIFKHHEWWNGSGYPFGLTGTDIPIECRMLSIIDAFDAMTNNRPYRKARSKEKAFKELRKHAGIQFDPTLVDLFIGLFVG